MSADPLTGYANADNIETLGKDELGDYLGALDAGDHGQSQCRLRWPWACRSPSIPVLTGPGFIAAVLRHHDEKRARSSSVAPPSRSTSMLPSANCVPSTSSAVRRCSTERG